MKILHQLGLYVLLFLSTNQFLLAQNVIVVVVDGARYSETFGAGSTYIPHLNNDLRPLGTLYTNFRIDSIAGRSYTNPGHATIITGTWQLIDNLGTSRPTRPTIFEYMRKEDGNPQSDCYVVTGKDKLDILTYSTYSGYGSAFGGIWVGDNAGSDALTYSKAVDVMTDYQPKILLISFSEVDVKGHTGNWDNYLAAITNVDNLIYQLWQHIEDGDWGYTTSNTTMFITNDHGRHDDAHGGFKDHGDKCDGCNHIMLLVLGRGTIPQTINNTAYQRDIAPTIGDLLGFDTPYSNGTSLFDYPVPLPVELSSFSASVTKTAVKLKWRTETEVSNYGFEILRSAQNDKWMVLGFVPGNGNSNSPKNYSFTDDKVNSGKYSYRLKQIDTDGQFSYSKTIEVNFGSAVKFELSQNYPNPFNPVTTIQFSIPQSSNVKLTVYNILGEQVAELINGFRDAGVHTVNFSTRGGSASGGDAYEFNSGLYIYKIESNGMVQTRKMLLVK